MSIGIHRKHEGSKYGDKDCSENLFGHGFAILMRGKSRHLPTPFILMLVIARQGVNVEKQMPDKL